MAAFFSAVTVFFILVNLLGLDIDKVVDSLQVLSKRLMFTNFFDETVSWCFGPSQLRRVISGLHVMHVLECVLALHRYTCLCMSAHACACVHAMCVHLSVNRKKERGASVQFYKTTAECMMMIEKTKLE